MPVYAHRLVRDKCGAQGLGSCNGSGATLLPTKTSLFRNRPSGSSLGSTQGFLPCLFCFLCRVLLWFVQVAAIVSSMSLCLSPVAIAFRFRPPSSALCLVSPSRIGELKSCRRILLSGFVAILSPLGFLFSSRLVVGLGWVWGCEASGSEDDSHCQIRPGQVGGGLLFMRY